MIVPLLAAIAIQKAPPAPGDTMRPFVLQTAQAAPAQWQPGRPAIITFCAFWCDTWKDQTARLRSVAGSLGGLPVDLIGISVDGRWTERGLQLAGMRFLSDPGGSWTAGLGVNRVPYTVVVDEQGVVRWAASGVVRSADVINAARAALEAERSTGTIYLTFDDFPSPHADDDALLDALRTEGISATFFCIGSRVASHAEVSRRAVREGSALQVHAWNHDAANPEIKRCKEAIQQTTGFTSTLYRAPGHEAITGRAGSFKLPVVDPYDYQRPGPDELARRVLTHLQPGCVIQLHAGVADTVAALPAIIRQARKRGLSFGVLR